MNLPNMLSAKKVKLHGMTSTRWTTKDKITQYKGLINLYTRDRKIIEVDTSVARKKQHMELKILQKNIEADRKELDNAVRGDKQRLRNTLAENRDLQLAFQDSPPKKAIESVHQVTFTKRKEFDKLQYQMKLKSQALIDLKLEKSVLEDRLQIASFSPKLPQEKEAEIITGKVQDAILRKEAALAIRQIYAQIIGIMKKDALYFDAILMTIQNDGVSQSKCMINATKLGQLACEYKDDRQNEFETLEKIVVKDMRARMIDLNIVQEQAENASSNLKQLLRRDSDVNICMIKMDDTPSDLSLQKDIKEIEATLKYLRNSTLVPTYKAIFPCLQEQLRQKERLTSFAAKCERSRDIIMNKMNHAELMEDVLRNTMVETTADYKAKKLELRNAINNENDKKKNIANLVKSRHNLTAQVRISLRQLQQLCKPIRKDVEEKKLQRAQITEAAFAYEEGSVKPPEVDEIDGCKILSSLIVKLSFLTSNVNEKLDRAKEDTAYKYFESMMKDHCITKQFETEIDKESLLQGLYQEVSHVLTRDDIKKQSNEIVVANTKNDDLVPLFTTKKKRRKFK